MNIVGNGGKVESTDHSIGKNSTKQVIRDWERGEGSHTSGACPEVEPFELLSRDEKIPPHDDGCTSIGMGLGISKGKGRAPVIHLVPKPPHSINKTYHDPPKTIHFWIPSFPLSFSISVTVHVPLAYGRSTWEYRSLKVDLRT